MRVLADGAADGDAIGGATLNESAALVAGARDMLLAAACSLRELRPVYDRVATLEAAELLDGFQLDPTDQDDYAVTLLTRPLEPGGREPEDSGENRRERVGRRLTARLAQALEAARDAAERSADGESGIFERTVTQGVNANLCEALAALLEPFTAVETAIRWAYTQPTDSPTATTRFTRADGTVLRVAGIMLRSQAR